MTIGLVVVSNRIARGKPNEPITGGLAAALLSVVEQSGATWVGSLDSRAQNEPLVDTLGKGKLVAVDLPAEHRSGYYDGFANSVLWPILHSRPDLAKSADADYFSYCEINTIMAGALLKFRDRTRVWVHDYHFLTLGAELRKLEIKDEVDFKKTLGFFLHTPWPEPATIRHLPKHGELIRSMLAYELIGFQTDECRQNFIDCVDPDQGVMSENSVVISDWGRTRCRVFPISIDTDKIVQTSAQPVSDPFVSSLQRSLNGGKVAISVDRIDYSKLLDNRIRAFDHLWAEQPRCISLLQIANPSRTSIKIYQDLKISVADLVRDVNGRHGADDWIPIRYVDQGFSQSVLAALYRIAKVGVVTPYRDGMNLVAKEYIAAQDPNDPGVLVLSKFAGAAKELDGAILVDPNDLAGMSRAISIAISMPLDERCSRWTRMMERLRGYTIQHWFSDFILELEDIEAEKTVGKAIARDLGTHSGAELTFDNVLAETSGHSDPPRPLSYLPSGMSAGAQIEDLTSIVGAGWIHGVQRAPGRVVDALYRFDALPRPFRQTPHFYIHGYPYSAGYGGTIRATPNNPLGLGVYLVPLHVRPSCLSPALDVQ